jgi:hypothetical protein
MKNEVTISPTPNVYARWATYKNLKARYIMKVSPNWEIKEDNENDKVSFTQRADEESVGNINYVTINSASDSSGAMRSQKDFDEWYAKNPKEENGQARLTKLDTTMIAGNKAVVLSDAGAGDTNSDAWTMVYWFRKGSDNFYITAHSDKKVTEDDFNALDYMVSTLKFY